MPVGEQAPAGHRILSPEEVAAYHRDGFLVPSYRLPPDMLAKLAALTSRVIADNPERIDQPLVGVHIPGSGTQSLEVPPGFLDIAAHPDILDLMEQLIGPDLILWGSVLFYKRAQQGPVTPWHRDATAYPIEPMATTSVWIAVTPSTRENGCLRFIPGSHRAREVGDHDTTHRPGEYFGGSLDPQTFDESQAVDVQLEPGQMVVFDVFTIHGGHANTGMQPRGGYSLRFMPGNSVFLHDAAHNRGEVGYGHETRALMLVRGKDRTGRNDFQRGHPAAQQAAHQAA
ncbi:phytanoyl-CoA dioxygenase family protein [Variovorax sp. KK3]|uniref:phytanoyl-CoA dioxygenase family protein n=1 Tax=Variovorax sp. KK3 TaxID=1855728 RepID=UPI00097C4B77|nr:phytanoyl-CoA dioxygenase family protein [Variovorax sp. KK3]